MSLGEETKSSPFISVARNLISNCNFMASKSRDFKFHDESRQLKFCPKLRDNSRDYQFYEESRWYKMTTNHVNLIS